MIKKIFNIFFILAISCVCFSCLRLGRKDAERIDSQPIIFPDYSETTLPVNIAPLNFIIKESADLYFVRFYGSDQKGFHIASKHPKIIIPLKKWKKLLQQNINKYIYFEISIKNKSGNWRSFKPVKNTITQDQIDSYMVYRRINSALYFWKDMDIVQRSLESFQESDIISNDVTNYNCVHCHAFCNNNPDEMLLHVREIYPGTYIKSKTGTLWLTTKTPYTLSSFVYPSWHPNGRYIAFSTNKIHQFFFGMGHRLNHVFDVSSDVVVYDLDKNLVYTSPKIASRNLENLPSWSPNGDYIYYINCPYGEKSNQDSLKRYDLMRIHFDETSHVFGEPELLISAKTTNMSISFPEVSPDGRFLLFCMSDYGYFTIGNPSSDLYMLDLRNGKYKGLDINSDQTESFHNWSSSGRWIVFASKRNDGLITLPYFSYVDTSGFANKPFVLPVKDPSSLETRLFNYNRPVFVKGQVTITQNELLKKFLQPPSKVYFDSTHVDIDGLAGATASADQSVDNPSYRKE